jgi:EAL domain-containing protein (putative c-di-GMP-specific phosphodiesterase class I)
MRHADVAMYLAKSTRSGVQRYLPAADHYTTERLAMVAKLKSAIDHHEVLVEYQPIIDVESGDVVAVECLARWHHPDHGWVSPDVFIPIAEHTGLIRPLTDRVIETAARQCRAWRAEGVPLRISVNVSARSLLDPDFPDQVERALAAEGIPPGMLTIEVTESSIMVDASRTIATLNRLAGLGVGLSVDDYGTGYSSLSYLKNLPVDELKIDRTFVAGMAHDRRDRVIVENTIELAHQLQLQVVAEGVEDATTMSQLRVLGCDRAQGFHLARPKTPGQLRAWLAERASEMAPADPGPIRSLALAERVPGSAA